MPLGRRRPPQARRRRPGGPRGSRRGARRPGRGARGRRTSAWRTSSAARGRCPVAASQVVRLPGDCGRGRGGAGLRRRGPPRRRRRGRPAPRRARAAPLPRRPGASSSSSSTTTSCRACASIDAPLLAVVGGSTGAGKSTLVNSVVGAPGEPLRRAAPHDDLPGARAPPRGPAVVRRRAHPARPGPRHRRGHRRGRSPAPCAWPSRPPCRPGMALLDAPDIDSVVSANRAIATQLLSAADLWLFVTTAARYADAVPWDLLRTAADRGTAVAIVLDRIPPEAVDEIRPHLAEHAARAGAAHRADLHRARDDARRRRDGCPRRPWRACGPGCRPSRATPGPARSSSGRPCAARWSRSRGRTAELVVASRDQARRRRGAAPGRRRVLRRRPPPRRPTA